MQDKQSRKRINRRWKRAEDWWWKQTGWKRMGHIRRGVSCPDLCNEVFSVDITTKKKIPDWLMNEMRDAEYHAQSTQTAIVPIHAEGEDMMDGLVVMRVREFFNLHVGCFYKPKKAKD